MNAAKSTVLMAMIFIGVLAFPHTTFPSSQETTDVVIKSAHEPVVVMGTILESHVIQPTEGDLWFPYALLTISVHEILVGDVPDTIQAKTLDCVFRNPEDGKVNWIRSGKPVCFPGDCGIFVMSTRTGVTESYPPPVDTPLEVEQMILLKDPSGSGEPFDHGIMVDRKVSTGNAFAEDDPEVHPRAFYKVEEIPIPTTTAETLRSMVVHLFKVDE